MIPSVMQKLNHLFLSLSEGEVATNIEVSAGFNADGTTVGGKMVGICRIRDIVNTGKQLESAYFPEMENSGVQCKIKTEITIGWCLPFRYLILFVYSPECYRCISNLRMCIRYCE